MEDIKELLQWKIDRLIEKAESLSGSINFLHIRLVEKREKIILNSMGEIGTRGSEIDRLCAEIELLKKFTGES